MTITEAKNKVTTTALGEVGYKETGKNITKYSAYFEGTDFYNGSKGDGKTWGAEWCDIFNDWCFAVVFGNEMAKKMLYQGSKSAGAGCKNSADFYKKNNAFYKTPEYGDQIFFYVGGEINHTGRVVGVSKTQVMTVEGNAGNAVRQNTYSLTDSKIAGYGRPDWSLVAQDKEEEFVNIEMPVLRYGAECYEVGVLQIMLNSKNYKGENNKPLSVDNKFGKNVRYAVHAYQEDLKKQGLIDNVDEVFGKKSWTHILKG